MADAKDLKSFVRLRTCGFESRLGHWGIGFTAEVSEDAEVTQKAEEQDDPRRHDGHEEGRRQHGKAEFGRRN